MKNKKKVIGLGITAILAAVSAGYIAVTGEAPAWLPVVTGVVTTVCNALGIAFVLPNETTRK